MSDYTTEVPEGYQRCTKCGEVKPATAEYFPKRDRNKLRSDCKDCFSVAHREACRRYFEKNHAVILEKGREYREKYPERKRASSQRYHANHKEEEREYRQRYQQEHRQKYLRLGREKQRRYGQRHPERIRKRTHQYRLANPEKNRGWERQRRARKENLPSIEVNETRALEYFHGCCAVCGRPLNDLFGEHTVAFDHWIPITDPRPDNPGTVPWNMVPLCHGKDGCNNSKNNRDPMEWLNDKFGHQRATQINGRIEAFFDSVRDGE